MLHVDVAARRGAFALQVAFELVGGGVIGLFGRSGSGKTTLINIVAGLVRPDRGMVALDGMSWCDTANAIDVPPERRHIGYVFQNSRLFPHLRVSGNLRYALQRARRPTYVSLDAVIALLDLEALLDRRIQQLSGGEAQRVAIGRALLTQPRLLLLDEPLAGLDGARREEVLPYLEALRDRLQIPMLYVSHRFDEVARLATRIVLLESGSSVAQGDVGAMSAHALLRAIVGPEEVATIIDAAVIGVDADTQTMRVRAGQSELQLSMPAFNPGDRVRLRLLARDVIVATQKPVASSARHVMTATVAVVDRDQPDSDLITLDVGGGTELLARVTRTATRELALHPSMPVWALCSVVSTYAHPRII